VDINIFKALRPLGLPGAVLGVFYLILSSFNFKFDAIDSEMSAIIVIVMLCILAVLTAYSFKYLSSSTTSSRKIVNLFYSGSDSMKLIKNLEENAKYDEIENSLYQMLWQMEQSKYMDMTPEINVLFSMFKNFSPDNGYLSKGDRESLKKATLIVKQNYVGIIKNLQKDYVPCHPERKDKWLNRKMKH